MLQTIERTVREVTGGKPAAEWLEGLRLGHDTSAYVRGVYALTRGGEAGGLPRVSASPPVQALYVAMRLDGTGHGLAEMLALQVPPMSNTDREFLEGHCNGSQFDGQESVGDYYAQVAREQGVDITGKVYMNGLASYPGDPTAWVAGRGDVERVAAQKGMTVSGSVNYRPDARLTDLAMATPDTRVADDLVQSTMMDRMAADPSLQRRDRGELFAETREAIAPHWE